MEEEIIVIEEDDIEEFVVIEEAYTYIYQDSSAWVENETLVFGSGGSVNKEVLEIWVK